MIHKIVQVYPTRDYKVYLYFANGKIKLFDAANLVEKGVFRALKKNNTFIASCTVLNDTLAWDLDGTFNASTCLDLDPIQLYETCPEVAEPEIPTHEQKLEQ